MNCHPKIINLAAELNCAISLRTPFWNSKLGAIHIDKSIADRLMVGVLPVHTGDGYFYPAKPMDRTAKRLFVVPTGFLAGQIVIDLIATDGQTCWRRLKSDNLLGDGEPVHERVGDWFKFKGRGSVDLEK